MGTAVTLTSRLLLPDKNKKRLSEPQRFKQA